MKPLPLTGLLLLLGGLGLAGAGYWLGKAAHPGVPDAHTANAFHRSVNAASNPLDALAETHVILGSDKVSPDQKGISRAQLRLALFRAHHDSAMADAHPMTVVGLQGIRDAWSEWVGTCARIGHFNARGGSNWVRMEAHAPYHLECYVQENLPSLLAQPQGRETLGPSTEKRKAMDKALSGLRMATQAKARAQDLANLCFDPPSESLHWNEALWRNELAPYAAELPRDAADAFLDMAIRQLQEAMPSEDR